MTEDREHRIRQRAYEMWEGEDRPSGRHDDHWHRAQREIDSIVQAQAEPAEAAVRSGAAEATGAAKPKRTARRTNSAAGGEVAPPKTKRTGSKPAQG